MAKEKIDRHVDAPQSSFTLLVDVADLNALTRLAKRLDRTRAYVIRNAIKAYLAMEAKR